MTYLTTFTDLPRTSLKTYTKLPWNPKTFLKSFRTFLKTPEHPWRLLHTFPKVPRLFLKTSTELPWSPRNFPQDFHGNFYRTSMKYPGLPWRLLHNLHEVTKTSVKTSTELHWRSKDFPGHYPRLSWIPQAFSEASYRTFLKSLKTWTELLLSLQYIHDDYHRTSLKSPKLL